MSVMHESLSAELAGTSHSQFLLRCPRCHRVIGALESASTFHACPHCPFRIPCEGGVWRALLPERAAYFSRFVEDYEFIRAREGRGSSSAEYYLALPDQDLSGQNRRQWAIRARTFHYIERRILSQVQPGRKDRLRILDLGAGNGWMSYRLARLGHSTVALDLIANEQDGLGAAQHYASHLPALFPRVQAELANLPFADHQFDVAIFNASFHYSESYETTLAEAMRCTRPGGLVLIADTAWYPDEVSGERMLAERTAAFVKRFGFPSNEIPSQEYLTDQRLRCLEDRFGIRFQVHKPYYGIRWQLRPWLARLRQARTPSQFRIYAAQVPQ
jgi:ubiquinone/menaquinone biosynthesis C-methylase UbiE